MKEHNNDDEDNPPRVVTVTFYRTIGEIPVSLQATNEGEVSVTEVSWHSSPVQVGDILTATTANGSSYHPHQVLNLECKNKLTGVVTMRFQNTQENCCETVRGSFFVQPQVHTCLPMALDFQQENEILTISSLEPANRWFSDSALEAGHSVVSINGSPCQQLNEEDVQQFLQIKLTTDPYLFIVTDTNEEQIDETTSSQPKDTPEELMAPFLDHEEEVLKHFLHETKIHKNINVELLGQYNAHSNAKYFFIAIQKSLARLECQTTCPPANLVPFVSREILPGALNVYAEYLGGLLPDTSSLANALKRLKKNGRRGKQSAAVWTPELVIAIGQVIGTCEYCTNQAQALEEMLVEKYTTQIDFVESTENFHEVIARAVAMLVSGVLDRLENSFEMMGSAFAKKRWGQKKSIEEESAYAVTMGMVIQSYVHTVARDSLLPRCYVHSFCDKFVLEFCAKYYNTILPLWRRLSHLGVQQLLLDLCHLKELCLNLQTDAIPFRVLVEGQFRRIEGLLKAKWMME